MDDLDFFTFDLDPQKPLDWDRTVLLLRHIEDGDQILVLVAELLLAARKVRRDASSTKHGSFFARRSLCKADGEQLAICGFDEVNRIGDWNTVRILARQILIEILSHRNNLQRVQNK